MKINRLFRILPVIPLFFGSCEIINPSEEIPSFLEINEVEVLVETGEGSSSHNLVDVWVFVDDDFAGAYELPARIPILKEGEAEILILPGIKENGIRNTRVDYPFLASHIENLNLVAGETFTILPQFEYSDAATFKLVEDFEMGSTFGPSSISEVGIQRTSTTSEVFEGSNSAKVELSGIADFFEGITSLAYELPINGSDVYIEMNYKSDIEFSVGFQSNGILVSKNYVVTVTPKDDWHKIYINIGKAIAVWEGDDYNLLFKAILPDDEANATILLDNIKLIH